MADVTLKPLPPTEAIAFFRSKGLVESFDWRDVSAQEHAVAFTVAKGMRRDVLQDIREGVDKALAEGRTFEQFKDELRPLLEAKGWWGRRAMTDPKTGLEREVQLGSARRLKTIFDVNLRQAYGAGRWERAQASKKAFPFLRYVAVGGKQGDGRTRLQHRAWHGTILPIDDPWWETHYGPCDFGCRCTAQQVNARMMARMGWTATTEPVKFPSLPWINPRTGEASIVESGIGPGFNYNPGKARLEGLTPSMSQALPKLAGVAEGGQPPITPRPAPLPTGPISPEAARKAFYDRFSLPDGGSRIYLDLGGEPFAVGPGLFKTPSGRPAAMVQRRTRGLGLAAEAIRDPDEIRWVWQGAARPALVRRYIRRAETPEGVIDVLVDATVGGGGPSWSYRTTLDGALDLDAARVGTLAWRRLPADLMEALAGYTGEQYGPMNRWLRAGQGDEAAVRELISGLDVILEGRRLTREVELWRGLSEGQVRRMAGGALRVGDEILDPGFMSTASVIDVAARFQADHPDGILMRILAKPGTRALDVSRVSSVGTSEYEILFARGTRLKVLSFDRKTRVLTVETIVD